MSNYFSITVSIEYYIILHKESNDPIFIYTVPGIKFDSKFIDQIREAIRNQKIELPQTDGDITQSNFKKKPLMIRAGKQINTLLIMNLPPNRYTRELLHSFSIRFETRWEQELKQLYDELNGDITVFQKNSEDHPTITSVLDEVFHLNYTLPYQLGIPTIELTGVPKKVWEIAEKLAKKENRLYLKELFSLANEKIREKDEIPEIIYNFIRRKDIYPIPYDEFAQNFS